MTLPYDSAERVATYDTDMAAMHPHRATMIDIGLAFLPFAHDAPLVALDLGLGTGFFSKRFLDTFTSATVIAIEAAPAMVAMARTRLAEQTSRVDIRVGDFRDLGGLVSPWERGHVVLSSYALHHLTTEEKTAVARRALQFLEPGGWWLNADLIVAASAVVEARIQQLRVEGIVRRAGWRDERFKDGAATRAFLDALEARDRDQPITLEQELAVLRDAGFAHAAPIWVEHREAVTVAVK